MNQLLSLSRMLNAGAFYLPDGQRSKKDDSVSKKAEVKQSLSYFACGSPNGDRFYKGSLGNIYQNYKCAYPLIKQFNF